MSASKSMRKTLHAAVAIAAINAWGGPAAHADVLLSNFEGSLGNGIQGWFNYNGNISALGLVANPTGGTSNWMSIEYNNTVGAWATAGPTIQPWANSNFSDTAFQANNFLQFDVIFPSNSWLSNDPTLPIGLNSNGGGDGLLATIDTTQKDVVKHVAIDYTNYKSSNGGPGNITDWMNLLFGHPDESQFGANPFTPRVYVDNIYLTQTSTPPASRRRPIAAAGTSPRAATGRIRQTGSAVSPPTAPAMPQLSAAPPPREPSTSTRPGSSWAKSSLTAPTAIP